MKDWPNHKCKHVASNLITCTPLTKWWKKTMSQFARPTSQKPMSCPVLFRNTSPPFTFMSSNNRINCLSSSLIHSWDMTFFATQTAHHCEQSTNECSPSVFALKVVPESQNYWQFERLILKTKKTKCKLNNKGAPTHLTLRVVLLLLLPREIFGGIFAILCPDI